MISRKRLAPGHPAGPVAAAIAIALPIGVALAVASLRGALDEVPLAGIPLVILAVAAGAWLAGFWPAVVVTAASAFILDFFLLEPLDSFEITNAWQLSAFVTACLLLAWFISQWKAAQGREATSRRETEDILNSINDAFYALDDQWRFRFVSKRAEELWRVRGADLQGREMWEAFPDARGTESYEKHMEAARTRSNVRYETLSPILGRWIDVSIYPRENGLSIYFRDVHDKKQVEDRLRRRNQYLETLYAVSQRILVHNKPKEILSAILDDLTQRLDVEVYFNFVVDDEEGRLRLDSAAGVTAPERESLE